MTKDSKEIEMDPVDYSVFMDCTPLFDDMDWDLKLSAPKNDEGVNKGGNAVPILPGLDQLEELVYFHPSDHSLANAIPSGPNDVLGYGIPPGSFHGTEPMTTQHPPGQSEEGVANQGLGNLGVDMIPLWPIQQEENVIPWWQDPREDDGFQVSESIPQGRVQLETASQEGQEYNTQAVEILQDMHNDENSQVEPQEGQCSKTQAVERPRDVQIEPQEGQDSETTAADPFQDVQTAEEAQVEPQEGQDSETQAVGQFQYEQTAEEAHVEPQEVQESETQAVEQLQDVQSIEVAQGEPQEGQGSKTETVVSAQEAQVEPQEGQNSETQDVEPFQDLDGAEEAQVEPQEGQDSATADVKPLQDVCQVEPLEAQNSESKAVELFQDMHIAEDVQGQDSETQSVGPLQDALSVEGAHVQRLETLPQKQAAGEWKESNIIPVLEPNLNLANQPGRPPKRPVLLQQNAPSQKLPKQCIHRIDSFMLPPAWKATVRCCRSRRSAVHKNVNVAGVNVGESAVPIPQGLNHQEEVVYFDQPDHPAADTIPPGPIHALADEIPPGPSHGSELMIHHGQLEHTKEDMIALKPGNPSAYMVQIPVGQDHSDDIGSQVNELILQGAVQVEMATQEGEDSETQLIEPSQDVHRAEEAQVEPLEPPPQKLAAGEGQEANIIPEANHKSGKRRGRPPKRSARSQQNVSSQRSSKRSRKRINDFTLPAGWTTEVRYRQTGRTAGNKDTYYIEEGTSHACRSRPEVMKYIRTKAKRQP